MTIHDMTGKRVCTLYDSKVPQDGAACGIHIKKEISGWKELSFNLSKYIHIREPNFRCNFIKNEHLLYVMEDGKPVVSCIKSPAELHDNSKIQFTVSCNHISEELKTKNLYKYFDDLNGIGTCEELAERALRGSGWKLVSCDKFYEADGITEKVRSYSCEAKTGAYNMLAGICELFDARPEFDGYSKEVRIKALTNTEGWMEILYGKNMDKIKRTLDSSNLITRLYVEGEYGDFGYVGIDDVPENESGLPFILNFDYFKELGVFTDTHQEIVDGYLAQYKDYNVSIQTHSKELLAMQAELNKLIGNYGYAYYEITAGSISSTPTFTGDGISDEDAKLEKDDTIYIVKSTGSFEERKYAEGDAYSGVCVLKFDPTFTGTVAAKRDMIKASEAAIESYLKKLNRNLRLASTEEFSDVTVSDLIQIYKPDNDDLSLVNDEGFNLDDVPELYKSKDILEYAASIGDSKKSASANAESMNNDMLRAIELMPMIHAHTGQIDLETVLLEELDDDFSSKMGSMLKDGYWSDSNYSAGQEESLYHDALEISKKMARPTVTYDVSTRNLSVLPKYEGEEFNLAQTVRMYDPDLKINDHGIVSELDIYTDKPQSDSIKVKTDILDIGTKSFASILERITEMAEQVRRNRDVYRRASSITKDGTIHSDILEGAIDVMKTQLLSSASNWRTDENGNLIFISLDGKSAMMLCGGGFMISNSKNEDGSWNWRTLGTGDGLAADLIVTGFLSADRIEAKSITVNHLASDVGEKLDITSNTGIDFRVERIIGKDIAIGEEPITPEEGDLWLDTSGEKNVLKKWNGTSWEEVTDISSEELGRVNSLVMEMDGVKGEIKTIVKSVSDVGESVSEISQKADQIYVVVESEEGKTEVSFTDSAIDAISKNINLKANDVFVNAENKIEFVVGTDDDGSTLKITDGAIDAISENIKLRANEIFLSAEEKIDFVVGEDEGGSSFRITDDALSAIAENINLTANDSFNVVAGNANAAAGKTDVEFYLSTSNTQTIGGSWQTTAPDPEDGKYIWMRVKTTSVDGKTVKYSAAACITGARGQQGLQGLQGPQGDQGIPGTPGTSSYFHIKYSEVENPTSSSQMTETPSTYIGTYVDTEPTDSNDPAKYTWMRFQGAQGPQGEQGIPGIGVDGKTSYLHIKYSNDGGLTFTSNNGEDVGDYIGQYVDFTQADSDSVSDYKWSKIVGDPGADGADGVDGVSIISVIEQYYLSTSKTTQTGGSWQTTQPTWVEGKYIWTRIRIYYSDGTFSYTEPYCDATWEVVNEAAIYTGATEPASPTVGKVWLDTGSTPNLFRKWNGSSWDSVSDISEIERLTADLSAQQTETRAKIEKLGAALSIDTIGVHIYKPDFQNQNEVCIDDKGVYILAGGNVASSFIANGLVLGDYRLWHPQVAGGLAFNLMED